MLTQGNDQSSSVKCRKHGRWAGGVFFRPEPNEGAVAGYVCLHCWIEAGEPKQLPKEDVYALQFGHSIKPAGNPA
jgi:hypothetical protein